MLSSVELLLFCYFSFFRLIFLEKLKCYNGLKKGFIFDKTIGEAHMKKVIVLWLCLVVFAFANQQDSGLKSQYIDALKAYKSKDFKTTYKILSKLYLTRLSDAKLNFYLGRSAYETGHYRVALAAFERVEMLDPSNLRNKLEKARTYFMLKMYEDAEIAFEEVLKNPNIPKNVRTNIELYLSNVKKVQKKSFTYASIDVDWVYDSNVNYGSLDSQYNVSVGTLPATPVRSDSAFQVYANLVNIYDIGDKNGFAIKNRVGVFLKDYSDLNDYNVKYLVYNPSILYKETKYLAELMFGFDILKLGSFEYLRTYYVDPRFEYSHSNTLKSMAHFKYQKKSFSQTQQSDLDAKHYEFGYALQKILSPRSYVQANLTALREKKEHGTRIDVDYDEYRFAMTYANQFTTTYGGEIFAEYRRRAYEDYSNLFASTRTDNAGLIAATINA
jgi:tetratricopeptide (TPR) repeat protein